VPFRGAFAQLFTQDAAIASAVFGVVVLALAVPAAAFSSFLRAEGR
jgi:hypothetical protein